MDVQGGRREDNAAEGERSAGAQFNALRNKMVRKVQCDIFKLNRFIYFFNNFFKRFFMIIFVIFLSLLNCTPGHRAREGREDPPGQVGSD